MIPVFRPTITKEDTKAVEAEVSKGDLSGNFGEGLKSFEEACKKYHKVKYASLVNSGSSALILAVEALDLKKGDEVIVSSFTNIATCLAITHCGATPVAIDSDPDTWNIDVSKIEESITKNTKAIIPVHIFGHPADLDPIMKLAKKYKLAVIEDTAEAQGAMYKNKILGCAGTASCLSFYANKTITTGEGGMVLTNDEKVYEKVELLKNLAFEKPRFLHWYAGYNFRMPNYVAALGNSQMKRIDSIIKIKRNIASMYLKYLKNVTGIKLPVEKDWAKSTYWMFGIVIDPAEFGRTRDQIMDKLYELGIETRAFFIPMNSQPVFQKMGFFRNTYCPVAENLGRNGLYLPSGYDLNENQIKDICEKLQTLQRR